MRWQLLSSSGIFLLLAVNYLPALADHPTALSAISKRSRWWMYASLSVFILTGMYLGYDSTSIFWQQHRLILGLSNDFAFHDELRWVGASGVREIVCKHLLGVFVHFLP